MANELKYKRKNPFVILSHNFIKWGMLNWNEKDIYIILLMYADSEQKCFPSINTLCKVSGKSNKTVIKALKGLEEKHLLKKEIRITKNGQSSNLYTLYDFESVWESESIEQVPKIISLEKKRKQLYELARELNYTVTKEEKELVSEPTKAHTQALELNFSDMDKDNTIKEKNQVPERYTLNQIHQLFDYDILIHDNPYEKENIDTVMDILHTAMNTNKLTIRISGQDMPAMAAIGKLMKLDKESIMYAVGKFAGHTERVKNPAAYMLTILYNAPEQYHLDILNKVSYDMAHENLI